MLEDVIMCVHDEDKGIASVLSAHSVQGTIDKLTSFVFFPNAWKSVTISQLANARSLIEEREKILVDLVLEGRAHAMRRTLVNLQLGTLDELGRHQS